MTVPAVSGRQDDNRVVIGRISGIHGVRGWLKIFSYSRPRENIFSYDTWLIAETAGWRSRQLLDSKKQGKNLLALLADVDDRDNAQTLVGLDIAVERRQLPELSADEYYWCDLIGLEVFDVAERHFGEVIEIQETGANDVLVVENDGRYLVPLVWGEIVQEVDLKSSRIVIDWNPEYI